MPKFGKCPECGPNSREVPLVGIWCDFHYQVAMGKAEPAKVERTDVTLKDQSAKEEQAKLNAWFNRKIKQAPARCEMTGEPLVMPQSMKRSVVCHILAKAVFKSVQTHEHNCFYANLMPHSQFDNALPHEQAKMPIAKVCRERVALMWPDIAEDEKGKVPAWLVPDFAKEQVKPIPASALKTSNSKRKKK